MPDPMLFATALNQKSDHEVAVLGGAYLDSILADLVSLALRDDPKEIEDFVGLSADGRAPAGSFGARIQLAYLLGLIDKPRMQRLRKIKAVRNLFSHHVSVSFADKRVASEVKAIFELFVNHPPRKKDSRRKFKSKEEFVATYPNAVSSKGGQRGFFVAAVTAEMRLLVESCRRRKGNRNRTELRQTPQR